jgi:hypothetical protein
MHKSREKVVGYTMDLRRSFETFRVIFIAIAIASVFFVSSSWTQIAGHPEEIDIPIVDEPIGQASNWTNDTRLTHQADISVKPDIAVEGENVHVVWRDFRYMSHYVYAIPPFDTPRTITYSINALDYAKNSNSTPIYTFDITSQDTIPPEIEHEPFVDRMMGYETRIEAVVRDNSQVEIVKLDFTNVSGNRSNVSMSLYEDNPKYYFTYRATIPPQLEEGNITYFIWARDANGITNMTGEYSISVQSKDDNPPTIFHSSPTTILYGYEVYIEAKIVDDADVQVAELDYVDVNGGAHSVTMVSRGNNTYSFGIPSQPFVGTIDYSIRATDVNGIENRNSSYSVQIVSVDTELPKISHTPIKSAVVGYWVPMHAFVLDNLALHTANLSIDGGHIMLGLWSTDGVDNIYYKRSTDGGRTWDDGLGHLDVDRPLTRWGGNSQPRIAVEGENVHVIFRGTDRPGIYYTASNDNGRMWSAPIMLADIGNCDIAVHGDSVNVVWIDKSGPFDSRYLHHAYSTDGGRSWSYGGALNRTLVASGVPRIALDGQYLHVIAGEDQSINLRYMRGKWNMNGFFWDDGEGHEGEARVVARNDPRVSWPPQAYAITASGGKVHIAYRKEIYYTTSKLWCDGFTYDLYTPFIQLVHNGSMDNGSNWSMSTPTVLVDSKVPLDKNRCAPLYMYEIQGHNVWDVDLAFDGSTVHVAWSDSRDDNSTHEIYYETGDAEGKTWSNDTRLTFNETYQSARVVIATWDNVVHLSWQDTRDQWWDRQFWNSARQPEIYYKRLPVFPTIHPPEDMLAHLEGDIQENVNIFWSKSPDDIAGSNPVLQYELYYSTEYNRAGDNYQLLTIINANGSDSYHYVHMGAGNGDPNNYFYRSVAIDSDGRAAPCLTQEAKYTRWLTSGMQLVSIPLELRENKIGEVFQTLNYTSIWHYDSTDRTWKSCHSAKPYCFFPPIDISMAFWVNVSQDGYLTIAGIVPLTTWMKLAQGWNLVGYPSFLNDSSANVLAGLSVSRSEAYERWSLPFHLKLLSNVEEMKPGRGYWIYSEDPQYLVLKN